MSNKIRLRIHHRGKLVETLVKWYVNGEVTEMNWSWDVDYMSYMELEDMIKSEGYVNIKCLWYWHPAYSFSRGLRPLNNDQDVLQFSKDIVGYDVIDVYVEHSVGIPHIIDDSELAAELDVEDDVQCIGLKSADIIEEVIIPEEVSINSNVFLKKEILILMVLLKMVSLLILMVVVLKKKILILMVLLKMMSVLFLMVLLKKKILILMVLLKMISLMILMVLFKK